MTVLVVALLVAVALLGVLVVGLLRSHAEILRQLHTLGAGREDTAPGAATGSSTATGDSTGARPAGAPFDVRDDVVAPAGLTGTSAHDVVGTSPAGETALLSVVGAGHDTLLAFLSSGCSTCQDFWDVFGSAADLGLPPATRLVVVTQGPDLESVSTVRRLAPARVPVVMSTQAWEDYGVPGSPYFALVDGAAGRVAGEGSATSWQQVVGLCRDASSDRAAALLHHDHDHGPGSGSGSGMERLAGEDRGDGPHREARADRELAAAGILPGHPSLYVDDAAPVSRVPADDDAGVRRG
ncbi:MAG TPA: hypothetical protein VFR07_13750 [Mycobacteriales bacterium]|nr:hypothetical protein [Mycobacteriales bacterium]